MSTMMIDSLDDYFDEGRVRIGLICSIAFENIGRKLLADRFRELQRGPGRVFQDIEKEDIEREINFNNSASLYHVMTHIDEARRSTLIEESDFVSGYETESLSAIKVHSDGAVEVYPETLDHERCGSFGLFFSDTIPYDNVCYRTSDSVLVTEHDDVIWVVYGRLKNR